MDARAPRRAVVRIPNWLGDTLMARGAFAALRAVWPETDLVAVGPRALLDLLASDGSWSRGHASNEEGAVEHGPDVGVIFPPSFSSAWWVWRLGARRRIGFATDGRSALLTDAVRRPDRGDLHLAEEYGLLLERLGVRTRATGALQAPEAAQAAAASVVGASPYAVIGPGARYGPAKCWPEAHYTELARRLVARGLRVFACGSVEEREACERIATAAGVTSLAGRTPLGVLLALLARTTVAVCNDSGLAHLAAASGAPTVALFGSTSSAWTAPIGERVRVVQRAPVCSPCFQRTCRIGYRCLTDLSVDRVFDAACAPWPAPGAHAA